MRSYWLLPVLLFSAACATPTYIVATADDTVIGLEEVADDLAEADVVALGELHRTPGVHGVHHELLEALHARRDNLVIAMEMFERDTQTVLLQYLSGLIDEATFLAEARPWPAYARDYRPVIEYAKANGLVVLAANAPKKLASQVAKEGVGAVAGNPDVARETTAPEDEYWEAFLEAMKGHPGASPQMMANMYAAQCLKDDTMAESITDFLQKRRAVEDRPLVVLICGRMHSDHGRGTIARIKSRMPDLDVRVLSAETVKDASAGIYSSPRSIGSYVVVAPEPPPQKAVSPGPVAAKAETKPAAAPTTDAPAAAAAEIDTENLRPALGLMPDYAGTENGVLVGSVREGGAAEAAGIEAGDVILAIAGVKVTDVEHYTEVLDAQKIGKTIPVLVRRESAEVELQVKVGSRPRTR